MSFRHLYNGVQGHGHANNKHRQDSHYDHYGNHYDHYGDQNNYRYGDGPDDPWRYVRPNGRHQNKRALHNQNTHKNYNINNKQVYSDAYGGHANSHQSLQMHHSKEKYNQNTNNRQGPQINSSNEKFNQNVDFLGCQLNPMDWPPLMEEKLLKTVKELIQAELTL